MKGADDHCQRFRRPVGGPAFFAFINSSRVGFFPGPFLLAGPPLPPGLGMRERFAAGPLLLPGVDVEDFDCGGGFIGNDGCKGNEDEDDGSSAAFISRSFASIAAILSSVLSYAMSNVRMVDEDNSLSGLPLLLQQ